MADVTIVTTGAAEAPSLAEAEPSSPPVSEGAAEALAEGAEAVAEIEGAAVEEVSSDAVEIARINAERDTEIAETNAAIALAEIEARNGDDEWRTNMQEQMTALAERLDLLSLAASIPQPSPEEADMTTQSMIPLDTPAIEESETAPSGSESLPAEMEAVIVAPVKRRRRAI